jgi:hypothetical protein
LPGSATRLLSLTNQLLGGGDGHGRASEGNLGRGPQGGWRVASGHGPAGLPLLPPTPRRRQGTGRNRIALNAAEARPTSFNSNNDYGTQMVSSDSASRIWGDGSPPLRASLGGLGRSSAGSKPPLPIQAPWAAGDEPPRPTSQSPVPRVRSDRPPRCA